MKVKICPVCKIEKPADCFSFKTKVAGGKKYLASECKPCTAKRMRDRYRVNNQSALLRRKVFDLLGRVCVKCGFSDARALQVDHINNNGTEERKIYKGQKMYRHVLKMKGVGYQTLCANCNWIKRIDVLFKRQASN